MPDVLIGIVGGVIVVTVALDIFRSLLVPRESTRALRVAPLLSTVVFGAWHAYADRRSHHALRQTVRASFAPLILVLMFASWAGLLILGFALLFWADRVHFTPGFEHFGDAVYAAGSAFSTLGIDGHVAGAFTRATVLVCSISGLVIVTVVSTFLIAIQTGFTRREALVLRLESHVTLPPAGIAILETYAGEHIVGRLGAFFDAWELWAAEVAISHRAFPIMLFFRSNDSRCEWLAAFGAILDAAALVDATIEDAPAEARAGAHFLLRTGPRVLRDMARQFRVDRESPGDAADPARFAEHRERLARAGYALVADEHAAWSRFVERRETYAAPLAALGRRLRIDVDERTHGDEDSRPVEA